MRHLSVLKTKCGRNFALIPHGKIEPTPAETGPTHFFSNTIFLAELISVKVKKFAKSLPEVEFWRFLCVEELSSSVECPNFDVLYNIDILGFWPDCIRP